MSIKSSFPNTRPSLTVNFAKSKSLDSRITFTRAQSGTPLSSYLDHDGVMKYAAADQPRFDHKYVPRINLFDGSETPDSGVGKWAKGSDTTKHGYTMAPDNTNTAVVYSGDGTPGNDWVAQNVDLLANTTYTVSIYAKLISGTMPTIGKIISASYNNGSAPVRSDVLIAGNLTTEWKRFSTTFTNVLAVTGYSMFFNVDSDSTAQIAIWGAQIEISSSATEYNPGNEVDKFESRGLLIEQQKYNKTTYSDYSTVVLSNVAKSTTVFTSAPDGSNIPAFEANNNTSVVHRIVLNNGTTGTATADHTTSFFIKIPPIGADQISTSDTIRIHARWRSSAGTGSGMAILYTHSSKTYEIYSGINAFGGDKPSTYNPTTAGAYVEQWPNDWVRVVAPGAVCSSNSSNSWVSYDWNISSGTTELEGDCTVFLWGAQTEEGIVPTSYIKTGSGYGRTRSADNALIEGSHFTDIYNPVEGTMGVKTTVNCTLPAATYGSIFGAGSTNGRSNFVFLNPGNDHGAYVSNTGQSPAANNMNYTYTPGQTFTTFLSYREANFDSCSNSNSGIRLKDSTTSGALSSSMNKFVIGKHAFTNNIFGTQTISKIVYYPTKLSNTELLSLVE